MARAAAGVLGSEGTPMSDHRASAEYRALMLNQALRRLYSAAAAGTVEPKGATA